MTDMKYDVEVLKGLIASTSANIKMFQRYSGEYSENCLAQMVATRRFLAALVENDGVKDDNFKSSEGGWVGLDSMQYSAPAGADTSKWTYGT